MKQDYNPIKSVDIINQENTPEIFKQFSMVELRKQREKIIVSISEIEKMLEDRGVDHSNMDIFEVSNVFGMCYPDLKWYGFLAGETDNNVCVWSSRININKPSTFFGSPSPSEVNWSAIGSSDYETTKTFATLLNESAFICKCFNEK